MVLKSLKELFDQYQTDNPYESWMSAYASVCQKVAKIASGDSKLNDEVFEVLWLHRNNGVGDVGRGMINTDMVNAVRSELWSITELAIKSPTPETFEVIFNKWNDLHREKKVEWRPWAMTHRLFAAAAPSRYSSILGWQQFNFLMDTLVKEYGLSISRVGNWAQQNINLLDVFKSLGFQDVDPIKLNTFLWYLIKQFEMNQIMPESLSFENSSLDPNIQLPKELNTIYYGPPGTGKTYCLDQLKKTYFTVRAIEVSDDRWLESIFSDLTWWEVLAAALSNLGGAAKVPELQAHPFVQAKLRISNNGSYPQTIWQNLQTHAPDNSPLVKLSRRSSPTVFDKKVESVWSLLDDWIDYCPGVAIALEKYAQGKPESGPIKRYEFITFHQSYSYEEFVEGIRPVLSESKSDAGLGYVLQDGVFKRICSRAAQDTDNKYAIFIDEINRGNISKIMGELITLVEDSKRKGAKEELSVKLPYSGEYFSVPSNLYIIGTMNTADRSLALMDTALRRRFSFEELQPDPSLLSKEKVNENGTIVEIDRLLTTMNQRIEVLYDREHTLGHSFFMGELRDSPSLDSLQNIFSKKIIPLLQEYFYDDWDKIRLVLGDNQKSSEALQFVKNKKFSESRLFGDYNNHSLFLARYELNDNAFGDIRAYLGIYDPESAERAFQAMI